MIGGLSISMSMFFAPLATYISNRYHYKVTMSIGLVLQSGGFLCASWATEVSSLNKLTVDMASLPYAGTHVRNWVGPIIRLGGAIAQSMVP